MGTDTNPPTPPREPITLNSTTIIGSLSAEPDYRILPSGVTAASFSVTVRAAGEKTTAVPVVWYDPPKRFQTWQPQDDIVISGSVVRRFYRGAGGLGSSTEVVVRRGELVRRVAPAMKLLARDLEQLEGARVALGGE